MEVLAEVAGDTGIADVIGGTDGGPGVLGAVGGGFVRAGDQDAFAVGVVHLADVIGATVVIRVEFDEEVVFLPGSDDLLKAILDGVSGAVVGRLGVVMDEDLGSGFGRFFGGGIGAVIRDHVDIEAVLGVILVLQKVGDGVFDDVFFVACADDDGAAAIVLAFFKLFFLQPEEENHDELKAEADRRDDDDDPIEDLE